LSRFGKFALDLLQLAWISLYSGISVGFVWFWKRQPETLSIEIRKISRKGFYREFKE
jgi:DHA1 family bicyclomycin/chloramphenicol resistance-like MFS transporter